LPYPGYKPRRPGFIAGVDHDPVADRYGPGQTEQIRKVAAEVAARIAATLRYE